MTLMAESTETVLNASNELQDTDKGCKDNFTKDKNQAITSLSLQKACYAGLPEGAQLNPLFPS